MSSYGGMGQRIEAQYCSWSLMHGRCICKWTSCVDTTLTSLHTASKPSKVLASSQ